jgi:HAE1 family hydrophobic/amphiphilic exporter-1
MKGISTEFFPSQDDGRIGVTLELPIGSKKEIAQKLASELANKWLNDEKYHVIMCNYRVGQADEDNTFASMQDNGSHIISFNIRLEDPGDRDVSQDEICEMMRRDINRYPEFKKYQVASGGGGGGLGGQSSADFEIYGYDMDATDRMADAMRRSLEKVQGVSEVAVSRADYQPEYQVDFDREKLSMFGTNLSTAGTYLRNRFNGAISSQYREDGEEYDIKVRYAPEFRESIENIENILIYNSRGQAMRVKDLGVVVERSSPPTIERKDRQRIVTVSAIIGPGAALGDIVAEGQKIIKTLDIPYGINIQISGSYEDQQETFMDLGTLAVLIVILVFIVMAAQFESLTYPFIIMFSLPFAFSGVILFLYVTGTTLSVMSLLGAIMLIGIVVKNGIVLIDYITLCRERGQGIILSVVTGGKSRLRPVLMTTLTTILGMIPMAVGTGQGAEMWRPMGIAVIGGLSISTILTLILVPVLYCSFAGFGVQRARKKLRKKRAMQKYFDAHKQYIIKK